MNYFLLALLALVPTAVFAQNPDFVPLTTLPGLNTIEAAASSSLPDFFNMLYRLCIGAAATIAIFNIMYAGFMSMTQQGSVISAGKVRDRITNSILGLLLVLSPAIVFGIIDPRILNLNIGGLSQLKLNPTDIRVNNGIFLNGTRLYDASDEQTCAAQESCQVVDQEIGGETFKYCQCASAEQEAEGHDPSTEISGRLLSINPLSNQYLLVGSTIQRFPNNPGCVLLWGGVYTTRNQCTDERARIISQGVSADLLTYDCRVTENREYRFADTCVDQPQFFPIGR